MEGQHLTAETWRQLLNGEPFNGRDGLVQHLAAPCPVCEETLTRLPPSEEDGIVDAWLLHGKVDAPGGNDVEFRHIIGKVRGRPTAVPLAAAAALVIAITASLILRVSPLSHPEAGISSSGMKGPETTTEVGVSFAIAWHDANGSAHVEKGVPGHLYPADRDLLFRYRISEPGYVALVREGDGNDAEVIVDASRASPGEHDIEAAGRPAGYSLRSVTGHQRFVVVFSSRLLPAADFEALARKTGQLGPGAAVAAFDIQVER